MQQVVINSRQPAAVNLAVGIEWHGIQMHVGRRNHVGGQSTGKVLLQCVFIHTGVRSIVEADILSVDDLCRHLADTRKLGGTGLYLTHFNTQSTQLHLIVDTPKKEEITVRRPAHLVASTVAVPTFVAEEATGIFLSRMQITPPHTCSTDNQFAGYPLWNQSHITVHHIQLYVGYRAADDGRVVVPVYLVAGRTKCSLRWSVKVVHVEARLLQGQQFLTGSGQQPQ